MRFVPRAINRRNPVNFGHSRAISSRLNTTGNRSGLFAGTASKNPSSR
jgi:hypothetical protein